jgi:NAD(P) transhydrogenase subunit alpha
MNHTATLVSELTVLVLAIFLGFEVISKVPTMLHTPLMSGTNAIHGIVIVGAMIVAGSAHPDGLTQVIGFVAMVLAAANVVGGFVVTDRMLEMFKKREPAKRDHRRRLDGAGQGAEVAASRAPEREPE